MATKKNKHISDMSTNDLKSLLKKAPLVISEQKVGKDKKKISVNVLDEKTMKESFKISQKDYDKFYKLGMKYAREYNKMVLDTRKGLSLNLDQSFGWTDGFVEGALQTLYKGMEKREWGRWY